MIYENGGLLVMIISLKIKFCLPWQTINVQMYNVSRCTILDDPGFLFGSMSVPGQLHTYPSLPWTNIDTDLLTYYYLVY